MDDVRDQALIPSEGCRRHEADSDKRTPAIRALLPETLDAYITTECLNALYSTVHSTHTPTRRQGNKELWMWVKQAMHALLTAATSSETRGD